MIKMYEELFFYLFSYPSSGFFGTQHLGVLMSLRIHISARLVFNYTPQIMNTSRPVNVKMIFPPFHFLLQYSLLVDTYFGVICF